MREAGLRIRERAKHERELSMRERAKLRERAEHERELSVRERAKSTREHEGEG